MSLFFIVFFMLYSGMHVYAFLRARAALAFGAEVSLPLVAFMAIMVLAPVLIRQAEKHGLEFPARLLSYVGYTWMGVIFLFFCASAVLDLYRLLLYSGGLLSHRNLSHLALSARYAFFIPLAVSLTIAVYGYFEALMIRTEHVVIRTAKVPKDIGALTIAQISDVHAGLIVGEGRLTRILDKVREAKPDILVSTGDLVDGQINGLGALAKLFQEIKPRFGKYAVPGNHEYYAGIKEALEFTKNAGFTVLRGESATTIINIAGVDDPAGEAFGIRPRITERELLSDLPQSKFTLFLKHRPLIDKGALGHFDLQLSGHSHNGQIFPFTLIVKYLYPDAAGWMSLPDNSNLYVSRGSGTWGPPIRFLAPPEVTIIELVHEDRKSRH